MELETSQNDDETWILQRLRYYSFQFPVGEKHLEFLITDSVGLEGGVLDEAPKGRRFEEAQGWWIQKW